MAIIRQRVQEETKMLRPFLPQLKALQQMPNLSFLKWCLLWPLPQWCLLWPLPQWPLQSLHHQSYQWFLTWVSPKSLCSLHRSLPKCLHHLRLLFPHLRGLLRRPR